MVSSIATHGATEARGVFIYMGAKLTTAATKMDTKFLSFAVALLLQAGGIVWWASSLQAKVRHNDYQIQMMAKDVTHNSKFVLEWPSGSWGSGELPSDTRQDLKIESLEQKVDKLSDKILDR